MIRKAPPDALVQLPRLRDDERVRRRLLGHGGRAHVGVGGGVVRLGVRGQGIVLGEAELLLLPAVVGVGVVGLIVLVVQRLLDQVPVLQLDEGFVELGVDPGKVLGEGSQQRQQLQDLRVLRVWVQPDRGLS